MSPTSPVASRPRPMSCRACSPPPGVADPDSLAGIDRALPVLLVSGSDDPLAGAGGLIHLVANRYQAAGLTDVEVEIYPGARHEVFNETNRDEITQRVADWLLAHSSLAPRHP